MQIKKIWPKKKSVSNKQQQEQQKQQKPSLEIDSLENVDIEKLRDKLNELESKSRVTEDPPTPLELSKNASKVVKDMLKNKNGVISCSSVKKSCLN